METKNTFEAGTSLISPETLRLDQNYAKKIEVKKELITIPVRKPKRQDFIRVHPNDSYCLKTAVLEMKDDGDTYLVDPELWPNLSQEIIPKALITYISKQGVLGLWPIRLPGEDGRLDQWNSSALEIAELAKTKWLRVMSNMALGAYEAYVATGPFPDPEFPEMTFEKILRIAFRDKFITTLEHPVIERLRGAK